MSDLLQKYIKLSARDSGTVRMQDGSILAYLNNGRWHVCASMNRKHLRYKCGSSSPPRATAGDPWERTWRENAELTTPLGYIEKDNLCRNCRRMMEDEYDLVRVTVGVKEYDPHRKEEPALDRFISRWKEESDHKT